MGVDTVLPKSVILCRKPTSNIAISSHPIENTSSNISKPSFADYRVNFSSLYTFSPLNALLLVMGAVTQCSLKTKMGKSGSTCPLAILIAIRDNLRAARAIDDRACYFAIPASAPCHSRIIASTSSSSQSRNRRYSGLSLAFLCAIK